MLGPSPCGNPAVQLSPAASVPHHCPPSRETDLLTGFSIFMKDHGDYTKGRSTWKMKEVNFKFQKISKGSFQNIMEEIGPKNLYFAMKVIMSKPQVSVIYQIK